MGVLVGVVGAGIVVVVVAATLLIVGSDDGGDEAALNEMLAASEDVTAALQSERSMAALSILEMEQLVEASVADSAEARRATDAAAADYAAMAAGQNDAIRSQLDGALDALDGLQDVRSEIDSRPAGASQVSYANEVFDRYSEVIDAVFGAQIDVLASSTDDPDARLGLDLLEESGRQLQVIPRVSNTMAPNLGAMTTPESIEAVATLQEELLAGRVTVMELAEGTVYEAPAVQLDSALEAAGLTAVVDDALTTGQADFPRLLDAMPAATDAWLEFQSAVEGLTLDRIAD